MSALTGIRIVALNLWETQRFGERLDSVLLP